MTDPDQTNTVPTEAPGVLESGAPASDSPSTAVTGAAPAEEPLAPQVTPGAGLRYAVLRLLMLITVGGVLYLIGMRGWALLFAAVLLSAIASFFVFMRQREAAARNLEAKAAARSARRHAQAPSVASPEAVPPAGSES